MTVVMWTCVVLFFFSLLRFLLCFDRLLKREHQTHPDIWRNDGRPSGFFWIPDGMVPSFRGWSAQNRLMLRLFFRTPSWVAEAEEKLLLKRLRLWGAMSYVWIVCAILSCLVLHARR